MNNLHKFTTILLVMLTGLPLAADIVKSKGVGVVEYRSGLFSNRPQKEIRREAIERAKVNALDQYSGHFSDARLQLYQAVRDQLVSNIDACVVDYTVVGEKTEKSKKIFRVVIEASINDAVIENTIQNRSAAANAPAGEKAELVFVFVAREQTTVQEFDARETAVSKTQEMEEGSEAVETGAGSADYSGSQSRTEVTQTGGSTLRRSDKIEYDVTNAADINAAVTRKFTVSGFEVVESTWFDFVDPIIEEFRYGDDLSGATLRPAVRVCQDEGIKYFATATLDVDVKDVDPVTGLTRVFVSVNGKIYDLSSRRPKTVATIGPVQYSGLGPSQTVARRNALLEAGEKAAQTLTDQMRARGAF